MQFKVQKHFKPDFKIIVLFSFFTFVSFNLRLRVWKAQNRIVLRSILKSVFNISVVVKNCKFLFIKLWKAWKEFELCWKEPVKLYFKVSEILFFEPAKNFRSLHHSLRSKSWFINSFLNIIWDMSSLRTCLRKRIILWF